MLIHYHNMDECEFPHIHDWIFSGFQYLYGVKQNIKKIVIELISEDRSQLMRCELNGVILQEFQGCSFWGGGNAVYYANCYKNHPFLERMQAAQKNAKDNSGHICEIDTRIAYIVFELTVNCGDELAVICESVEYEITDL